MTLLSAKASQGTQRPIKSNASPHLYDDPRAGKAGCDGD